MSPIIGYGEEDREHKPIFDQLNQLRTSVEEIKQILTTMSVNNAVADRSMADLLNRLNRLEVQVQANTYTLYGKDGGTGLIALLQKNTDQLATIRTLVNICMGAIVSGIIYTIINFFADKIK